MNRDTEMYQKLKSDATHKRFNTFTALEKTFAEAEFSNGHQLPLYYTPDNAYFSTFTQRAWCDATISTFNTSRNLHNRIMGNSGSF